MQCGRRKRRSARAGGVWRGLRAGLARAADANGVPIGGAQKVGCVYGVRYERGQTANVLVDIPGVIARMDAPRLCCASVIRRGACRRATG